MSDYYLNVESIIRFDNFRYLEKEWQWDECDLCGDHSYDAIFIYLKDKRFLVYGNIHNEPGGEKELLKVGKVHWWGRSFYDMHENNLFPEEELNSMHL